MSNWLSGEDKWDRLHAACRTKRCQQWYMYLTYTKKKKFILACLNSSVTDLFKVSSPLAREKRRIDDHRLCRPLELCSSLQICTWREIDATLLCCTALRYICEDNEIEFHPYWTGWWHQYEIALVFPWPLHAFDKGSLSCLVGSLTCIFLIYFLILAVLGSLKDMILSIQSIQ